MFTASELTSEKNTFFTCKKGLISYEPQTSISKRPCRGKGLMYHKNVQ